jgi:hypothetical protein
MPEIDAGANAHHASNADSCAGAGTDTVNLCVLAQAKRGPASAGTVQCHAPVRLCALRGDCARPATDRDATIDLQHTIRIGAMKTGGDHLFAGALSFDPKGDWQ